MPHGTCKELGNPGASGAQGQAIDRGLPGVRCPPEDDNRGTSSDGPEGGRHSEPHSGCRTEPVRSSGIRGPRGARGPAIDRGLPGVRCPPEDDNRGAPSDNRVVPDNSVNPTALRFQRLLKSGASVRVIFGELDSDKNGYVTRYEWIAKGGDTATFRGLLERFDANDDAQFDMREARLVWSDNQIEEEVETNEDQGLPAPDRRTNQKGPYRYIGPQK
ncbi:hypothetical protein BSL78_25804 [Apostichopus japonicus]|uniref:EF-hand domain-containing protein n=1 Tax=Stichopus japonicus TaxID=307972 RepID=A0A2G8JNM0_STIJA|nr:hypothetical protein BSL78_25804 [Apostichopus japonicus]